MKFKVEFEIKADTSKRGYAIMANTSSNIDMNQEILQALVPALLVAAKVGKEPDWLEGIDSNLYELIDTTIENLTDFMASNCTFKEVLRRLNHALDSETIEAEVLERIIESSQEFLETIQKDGKWELEDTKKIYAEVKQIVEKLENKLKDMKSKDTK